MVQLAFLRGHDPELAALVESVAADEADHLAHAVAQRAGRSAPFGGLIDWAISATTEGLMWLSTRGDVSRLARELAR